MTLIIYDNTGKIWVTMSGSYTVPIGIPYLEVEVPAEQHVVSVDVSVTPHAAVLEANPVDPVQTRLTLLEDVVNMMLLA